MRYKAGLLVLLCICSLNGWSQGAKSLKINEILVINEDNFEDDYGKKFPWIEIYNSSPVTVNIAGCYLTNDLNNPRKYPIPKGDVLTKISPRQHVLFWADNIPTRGTFHLSFTLDSVKPNFIALFDSDGTTLIDSITVPAGQQPDISYGLVEDGWTQSRLEEELRLNSLYNKGNLLWIYYTKVTPSSNNVILDTNDKIENFKINDSLGYGMTITAMLVVFFGLILLYLLFKLIGKIAFSMSEKRAIKAAGYSKEEAKSRVSESGEVFAAIAMAISEITDEDHDAENMVLTMKNVERNYSPWSSKIYTLRELPKK
jgi:Na+-transporting methylmalonyl-CoA/oxaloacetate decarboxylase gamma subunit